VSAFYSVTVETCGDDPAEVTDGAFGDLIDALQQNTSSS
jgi:hypothetical protein